MKHIILSIVLIAGFSVNAFAAVTGNGTGTWMNQYDHAYNEGYRAAKSDAEKQCKRQGLRVDYNSDSLHDKNCATRNSPYQKGQEQHKCSVAVTMLCK